MNWSNPCASFRLDGVHCEGQITLHGDAYGTVPRHNPPVQGGSSSYPYHVWYIFTYIWWIFYGKCRDTTIHVSHGLCRSEVFGNQVQLKVFGSDPNLFVSFFWGGGGGAKDDLIIRIPQKVNLKRFSQIGSIKYQVYQCTMLQDLIFYNLTGGFNSLKNISQTWLFPQALGWKSKIFWNHHLAMILVFLPHKKSSHPDPAVNISG